MATRLDALHNKQLEFPNAEPSGGQPLREPWWVERGYESADAFWEALGADFAKDPLAAAIAGVSVSPAGESPDPESEIPEVGVPGLAELSTAVLERELSSRRGFRQVGIKLRPDDYDALAAVAREHGIAPTTLARILTARGARELAGRTASPRNESGA